MWSLGAILYYMIYGYPPNYNTEMIRFQTALRKWEGIDKMEVIDRGYSEELADFLDRLLKRPWIERITVPEAWNHPWLQKYRTRVAKIPRALAVESTLNYVGHSFARSKLFQLTAYLISRFLLPQD